MLLDLRSSMVPKSRRAARADDSVGAVRVFSAVETKELELDSLEAEADTYRRTCLSDLIRAPLVSEVGGFERRRGRGSGGVCGLWSLSRVF